jgi:DNA-binding transcriptional ArsR family regulator
MTATVQRLRTEQSREQLEDLGSLRQAVDLFGEALPEDVTQRIRAILDYNLADQTGWAFTMVDANLFAEYVRHLRLHSSRPLLAVQLLAELIRSLPDDSNEVQASRAELAQQVGCDPADLSRLISEMEHAGIVTRERDGRGVRYKVDPRLGTHLAGKRPGPKSSPKKRRSKLAPV